MTNNRPAKLIVGFGVTGQSVAKYLDRVNIAFDVYDESNKSDKRHYYQLQQIKALSSYDEIIVSPGIPFEHPLLQKARLDNVKLTTDIEIFANQVRGKIIAITGSNGKSTVTKWLEFVLKNQQYKAISAGNIGKPVLDFLPNNKEDYNYWILELSSFQLAYYHKLKTEISVVLNVSDDHLDQHKNLKNYAKIKQSIYHYCQYPIINRDDGNSYPDYLSQMPSFGQSKSKQTKDFSVYKNAIYRHHKKLFSANNLIVKGKHNLLNASVVWMMAEIIGLSDRQIAQSLGQWQGLEHRFQIIKSKNKITWINDSKGTNIGALQSAIESCGELGSQHKLICLIGGKSKSGDFNLLKEVFNHSVEIIYLFGQDAEIINQQIKDCQVVIHRKDNLKESVKHCFNNIQKHRDNGHNEDLFTVLFSPGCASFDQFQNYIDRGNQFIQLVNTITCE